MATIKEMVLDQLKINPSISLKDCQTVVKGLKKDNFYKIKRENKQPPNKQKGKGKQKNNKRSGKVASTPSLTFIDDPDELLMSVSIRELNKPDPDPRWASILINAKKAKITIEGEDKELQRLSINTLVSKLNEKLPIDTKEETSLLFGNSQKV